MKNCKIQMSITECRSPLAVFVFLSFTSFVFSQTLVRPSGFNLHLFDYRAIREGKVNPYFTQHSSYEWRQSMPRGSDGLLRSQSGNSWLRKNRLKLFPAIDAAAGLKGGHVNRSGGFIDIAPTINMIARYRMFPAGRYSLIFWTRFEKHSVVSQNKISDLSYDLSWKKEVGKRRYENRDSSWIEYDIGDGGILLTHPGGEINFAKSNPIWGSGYTGQLWLSDKAPSFVFLSFRQRLTDKWNFSYLHGTLNSTFQDSSYQYLYPIKGGFPMIRKYIVAHRMEFAPSENLNLGFGESVIYGGRGIEMAYTLPFLFYWSSQHDLSDSDNLQMFLDFQIIKKGFGQFYGSLYLDEWDFVDVFNREKSRNWIAYQVGFTYALPFFPSWNSLFRVETTHLEPTVYVHKSKVNTYQHHGQYLGFWSGPNSDNIFLALEGSPRDGWWTQLYGLRTRRGEVSDITIEMQYNHEKIPFLYPEKRYPEKRTLLGIRGELLLYSSFRLSFDIFWDLWLHRFDPENKSQAKSQKIDGLIRLSIGL